MADARTLATGGSGSAKKTKLNDEAFGASFHGPLVHQSVRAEQAARRRGTASSKTRGLVSGGGAKPWRQKGTGRARAGSSRSPIWTGGGIVFGPQPRSYTFKVNRKERQAALRSALSLHASRDSIAIVDAASFSEPKTKHARELLEDWGRSGPTLVVLDVEERDAALSFRNLHRVAVLTPESVGVADLLGAANLLVSQGALDALTERATKAHSRGAKAGPTTEAAEKPEPRAAKRRAAAKAATAEKADAEDAVVDEPTAEEATAEQAVAEKPDADEPGTKQADGEEA